VRPPFVVSPRLSQSPVCEESRQLQQDRLRGCSVAPPSSVYYQVAEEDGAAAHTYALICASRRGAFDCASWVSKHTRWSSSVGGGGSGGGWWRTYSQSTSAAEVPLSSSPSSSSGFSFGAGRPRSVAPPRCVIVASRVCAGRGHIRSTHTHMPIDWVKMRGRRWVVGWLSRTHRRRPSEWDVCRAEGATHTRCTVTGGGGHGGSDGDGSGHGGSDQGGWTQVWAGGESGTSG
jgi:hypothetical protein